MRQEKMKALISDTTKLQSFIDNALIPLAEGLKSEPALGAYEIMNEPEGSVDPQTSDPEPCFDTKNVLKGSGAGWSGGDVKMEQLLRFHNQQAGAIKKADPKALVTVGAWSEYSSTDNVNVDPGRKFFNYYKDECLIKAGGDKKGVLDFYQIHTYAHNYVFDPGSPFESKLSKAGDYKLDKPVVIGEFSAGSTKGKATIQSLYKMAVERQFSGAWDWSMGVSDGNDDESVSVAGMASIRGEALVHVDITGASPPQKDTCMCSDNPPPGSYTCAQQAGWGKCGSTFMRGFCCKSCHACRGCA